MAEYDEYDTKHDPEEEEDGRFEDSSEEDDDENQDGYEQDDFLVADEDEEDEGDGLEHPASRPSLHGRQDDEDVMRRAKRKKKKKKRHYHDDEDLADDDFQLVEESGYRVDRRKAKRLKRLKKGASDDERDEEIDEDLRNLNREEDDDIFEERRRRADDPPNFDDDEDDMDDFIDDGGRGNRRRRAGSGFVSSEAVRTARSIFGDIDEISQYKGSSKHGTGDVDDDDDDYRPDGSRGPQPHHRADIDPASRRDVALRRAQRDADDSGAIAKSLAGPVDDKKRIEKIVETDIPERLQYHLRRDATQPSPAQIRDEANWIYRRGFLGNPKFMGNSRYETDGELIEKIVVVLSYIHIDKLDIPFIAMYRQDYVSTLLIPDVGECKHKMPEDGTPPGPMGPPRGFNSVLYDDLMEGLSYEHKRGVPPGYSDGFGDWSVLWLILDLDKKYANLTRRRNLLLDAIEDARIKGVPPSVLDDVRTVAHACDDEKDLRDGERHLRLAIELANSLNSTRGHDDSDEENNRRPKRPSRRRNRYTDFCKRGYRALTKELGINARQFGENLKGVCDYGAGSQVHVPLDSELDPRELAKLIAIRIGEASGDPSNVPSNLVDHMLAAARLILVTEIVSDLSVLQATRLILCRPGATVISTTPTSQGIAQVDDTHPLRCVTSLSEKKIEDFRGKADFALIRRAVELGFTKLEISFRQDQLNQLRRNLDASIVVESSTSSVGELWNEQRRLVTEEAHKILVKAMISKVRDEMEEETSMVLRYKLMDAASRRLLMGPTHPDGDDGCPRVLAIAVTTEDDEDVDPLQEAKDAEEAKSSNSSYKRRIANERITMVELDENGEYCRGYEMFAAWLRRKVRVEGRYNSLPTDVKDQLKGILIHSRAQVVVIGVGSGQRAPIRLHEDLIEIIREMVHDGRELPAFLEYNTKAISEIRSVGRSALNVEDKARIWETLSNYFVFVDENPCRIYSKTSWASKGLSVDGMTLLEKRTIGIGRLAQEPLWVYCAIGHEKELASRLQFHTYHFYANPTDRVTAFTRSLVRSTCVVGVDINRSVRLPHTQSLLSFIGGLGVHKAGALLKELGNIFAEEERGVTSRKDLLSNNYIDHNVFLSAAAFLRVRDPELHPGGSTKRAIEFRKAKLSRRSRNNRRRDDDGSILFDPRDDSRVHPQHYTVAGKIASEALRDDRGQLTIDLPQSDDYSSELRLMSAVLDRPSALRGLDLQQYASQLSILGRGNFFETVKVIADEFYLGMFRDHRVRLRSPDQEALFYMITGADPMLLRIGSAVTATSCELHQKRNPSENGSFSGISCMLPMNIRGFIKISEFSDERLSDDEIKRLVTEGSSLATRILNFNYERFEAELSSKVSIIEDPTKVSNYVSVVDMSEPSFRPYPKQNELSNGVIKFGGADGTGAGSGQARDKVPSRRQPDLQRRRTVDHLRNTNKELLQHQLFRNISGNEATVNLRSALPGEILIRPSQYSVKDVIFSCKFASLPDLEDESRTLLHITCQVIDSGAAGGDDDGGGCLFKIGNTSFEHVDQALDEHVRPILSNLSEALDHRKFMMGSTAEITKKIQDEKQRSPNRIPYYFGLSEFSPAGLVLIFIPGSKSVYSEEILVVPNGYKFRGTLHIHMEKLIAWFKLNMERGVWTGPEGRGDRNDPRSRPSTVASIGGSVGGNRNIGNGSTMASVTAGTGAMGLSARGTSTTPISVAAAEGAGTSGGQSMTPAPPPAPYQSPYHAPPRSPFVARGEPSTGTSVGGGGGMGRVSASTGGGSGSGGGFMGGSNLMGVNMGGMNMNMNMGVGMGMGSGSGTAAPVRDSAPPSAPIDPYNMPQRNRQPPPQPQQAAPSYNSNANGANRLDWSRATQQRDEPPPPSAMGMNMGAGGAGAGGGHQNMTQQPPIGRGGAGPSPAPGPMGRGGGAPPGPDPSSGSGGGNMGAPMGRGNGSRGVAWRGVAPVPAWKKKLMEEQAAAAGGGRPQ